MAITIENPTAETALEMVRQLSQEERERFARLFAQETPPETLEEEEAAWHTASRRSAARFFEEDNGQ